MISDLDWLCIPIHHKTSRFMNYIHVKNKLAYHLNDISVHCIKTDKEDGIYNYEFQRVSDNYVEKQTQKIIDTLKKFEFGNNYSELDPDELVQDDIVDSKLDITGTAYYIQDRRFNATYIDDACLSKPFKACLSKDTTAIKIINSRGHIAVVMGLEHKQKTEGNQNE